MRDKSNLPTVVSRITEYLDNGGLWNPELADHAAVSDLICDARDEIDRLRGILAALQKPSLALLFAGQQAYAIKIGEIYADEGHVARHHQTLAIDSAIRAAVAAAEQEVGG